MFQEFQISVTPFEKGQYLVKTEKVFPGVPVTEELVNLPIEDWLQFAQILREDWEKGSLNASVSITSLGQQLFNTLLSKKIQASWRMAEEIAEKSRSLLQLQILLQDPALEELPWEFLHSGDRFLWTGNEIAFSSSCFPGVLFYNEAAAELNDDLAFTPEQEALIAFVSRIEDYADESSLSTADAESEFIKEVLHSLPSEDSEVKENILSSPISPKIPLLVPLRIGAIAVAISSLVFITTRQTPAPLETVMTQTMVSNSQTWENLDTNSLVIIARQQLTQGDLEKGLSATEELLHRGALPYAETVFQAVSSGSTNDPEVNFLRGRLAWEYYLLGDRNFSAQDARRFWQIAVQSEPSVEYLNALGFAYYAEGNFEQANQAWYSALSISEQQPSLDIRISEEVLTTYAGLALGLQKLAQQKSGTQAEIFLDKAQKLHSMVMSENPVYFDYQRLTQDWMWSDAAIQDWQILTEIEESPF